MSRLARREVSRCNNKDTTKLKLQKYKAIKACPGCRGRNHILHFASYPRERGQEGNGNNNNWAASQRDHRPWKISCPVDSSAALGQ